MNVALRLAIPCVLIVFWVASYTATAIAETFGRDYYAAPSDRKAAHDLAVVEQHHYGPAVAKMQSRRYVTALQDIEFILRYFPNHPNALNMLGEWGVATKQWGVAEGHFKEAIGLYPQHAATHTLYGIFLHRIGRLNDAITEYKTAIELDQSSPWAHYNLGLAYVDRKQYEQANLHAQRAYQLGVTLPGLKRQLAAANAWRPLSEKPKNADVPAGPRDASPDQVTN